MIRAVTITFELPESEAMALAQLVKRITFTGVADCAVDTGEAHLMLGAIERLRVALAEAGYAPR